MIEGESVKKRVLDIIEEIKFVCTLQQGDCLKSENGCEHVGICIKAFGTNVIADEHSSEELYKMVMEDEE